MHQQTESSHLLLIQLLSMNIKPRPPIFAALAMDSLEAPPLEPVKALRLVLESGMDLLHLVKVEGLKILLTIVIVASLI